MNTYYSFIYINNIRKYNLNHNEEWRINPKADACIYNNYMDYMDNDNLYISVLQLTESASPV